MASTIRGDELVKFIPISSMAPVYELKTATRLKYGGRLPSPVSIGGRVYHPGSKLRHIYSTEKRTFFADEHDRRVFYLGPLSRMMEDGLIKAARTVLGDALERLK